MSGLPAFRSLTAATQLEGARDRSALLPRLLETLAPADAIALAANAALLFRALVAEPPFASPWEVLERLSLLEIAELCELYRRTEAGEIEYGEAAT